MNILRFLNISKKKIEPSDTNYLILELLEEYNREHYKLFVLKNTKKLDIKKNNYIF